MQFFPSLRVVLASRVPMLQQGAKMVFTLTYQMLPFNWGGPYAKIILFKRGEDFEYLIRMKITQNMSRL